MARITYVPGYIWPISVTCDSPDCGITFVVDNPADMLRHSEYTYTQVDGEAIPELKRRYVTAKCPICGKDHEIQSTKFPAFFNKAIPAASGENPIYG